MRSTSTIAGFRTPNCSATEGWAFVPLSNRLGVRRVDLAARCVGAARRLLELMVEQAKNRSTFGVPLGARQAVQFWIADTEIELHAARQLAYEAARQLDAGVSDIRKEASIAKVFATEAVNRIADRAIQLFGGMGLSKELPVEWIYRNSRVLRIADGASEILRVQIARTHLGDLAR
jgi:alkylation response protein AidB-like acyl-CoA dehydrogenase